MGEPIANKRWTAEFKQRVYSSRVESTKKIVEQIKKHKIANLISASAIGFYGDRGDQELDERSAVGEGFMARVCKDWEREAFAARETARCVAIRIGIVLGEEGALQKMMLPFRFGLGGELGSGEQWMSWIHLNDLHSLLIESLENGNYMGAINATAPNPVRQSDFAHTLCSELRRPCILKTPEFVLKMALGEMSELLLSSIKVMPRKATDLGFHFQYPDLQPALNSILAAGHTQLI
jgi:uncharacterized protein (TIGR01777 family)